MGRTPKVELGIFTMHSNMRASGFTLTELCCTLAVMLVILGLSLPAISAAREAARRMQCSSNIRQVGFGVISSSDTQNQLPESRFIFAGSNMATNDRTWMATADPFIHDIRVSNQTLSTFDLSNMSRFEMRNELQFCPSSPSRAPLQGVALSFNGLLEPNLTTYSGDYCGNFGIISRVGTVVPQRGPFSVLFDNAKPTPLSAFRAGRSNTILLWECANAAYYWRQDSTSLYEESWRIRAKRMVSEGQIWCSALCQESRIVSNEGTINSYFLSYYGGPSGSISLFGSDRQFLDVSSSGIVPINQVLNITNSLGKPFSFHPGVVVMVTADGATHAVAENVDLKVLLALTTLDDENGNFEIP